MLGHVQCCGIEKLWFRFRLLNSYGPGSDFRQVTVPIPVPVPKIYKFHQIFFLNVNEKKFNEGNQIHNFISSSGSGTVINYGFGSDFLTSYGSASQKVTVPKVPVPQHWPMCHGT
jgi:hypothetical protein